MFTSCTEGVPTGQNVCTLHDSDPGHEKKRYSIVYRKNTVLYVLDLKTAGTYLQKVTRGTNTVILQSCGA